jgi:lipid II isoglutaminyl synthase (glutamine-hydrolysing)
MTPLGVRLFHLYPDAMNLYGDLGNVLTLRRRCEWRGIDFDVTDVKVGDPADLTQADMVFMGGGQDRGQKIVGADLLERGPALIERVEAGMAALTICGGFQLFGQYFHTVDGTDIPGIGLFDAHTVGGTKRLIGNVVIDISETSAAWAPSFRYVSATSGAPSGTIPSTLVGFENHSGLTYLGEHTSALGAVVKGYGNLGDGSGEGGWYRAAFGTYLHGSLLPKNPWFADHLIRCALSSRYGEEIELAPLDDSLESAAHRSAVARARTAKTTSL